MVSTQRLTIDTLDDRGCINILSELLRMMAADFNQAYKNHLSDPDNLDTYEHYLHVKSEFLSDYFARLTRLNGEYIVRKLEEIAVQECSMCA